MIVQALIDRLEELPLDGDVYFDNYDDLCSIGSCEEDEDGDIVMRE